MSFDLGEQRVAGLLGVTQQHGRVRLVKDGIVYGGITDTQRSLHHDDLLGQPYFQNGHASDDGVRVLFGGAVDCVVGSDNKHQVGFLINNSVSS